MAGAGGGSTRGREEHTHSICVLSMDVIAEQIEQQIGQQNLAMNNNEPLQQGIRCWFCIGNVIVCICMMHMLVVLGTLYQHVCGHWVVCVCVCACVCVCVCIYGCKRGARRL